MKKLVVAQCMAALLAFVLPAYANAQERPLPDSISGSANVYGATVNANFQIYEDSGDVYLSSNISGGYGEYGGVNDQRSTNVSSGVNPNQGACWEITPSTGIANVNFWTEACSSGFHCKNGRKVISVASRSKVGGNVPTTIIREWFSGTWYYTRIPC